MKDTLTFIFVYGFALSLCFLLPNFPPTWYVAIGWLAGLAYMTIIHS